MLPLEPSSWHLRAESPQASVHSQQSEVCCVLFSCIYLAVFPLKPSSGLCMQKVLKHLFARSKARFHLVLKLRAGPKEKEEESERGNAPVEESGGWVLVVDSGTIADLVERVEDGLLGQSCHQLLGVVARQPVQRRRVHVQRFKSPSSSPWNKETLIRGGDRRDGDQRDGFIRQGRGKRMGGVREEYRGWVLRMSLR